MLSGPGLASERFRLRRHKEFNKALSALAKSDPKAASAVADAVSSLCEEPRPLGYEPIAGERASGLLRIRQRGYRIFYGVDDSLRIVAVVGIHKRGEAYEGLSAKGLRLLRMLADAAAELGGVEGSGDE